MIIYTFPFIAALIGWFTNFLAIKMLFHPRKEKRILGLSVQGVFPKRKETLAEKLGVMVAEKLFSKERLKEELLAQDLENQIKQGVSSEIEKYMEDKLSESSGILSALIGKKRRVQVTELITKEIEPFIPKVISKLEDKLEEVDLKKIVYEKVMSLDDQKLEDLIMDVIKKELRFIELAGAVLGFVIGLFQMGLLLATS